MIIDEVGEYVEEKNGNKYLILDSTDKNKEILKKYPQLWDGIKNSIEKVNNKLSEYGKDFMKFNSDDNLPLNKTPKLILWSAFEEDGKYYWQVFLDECLYEF